LTPTNERIDDDDRRRMTPKVAATVVTGVVGAASTPWPPATRSSFTTTASVDMRDNAYCELRLVIAIFNYCHAAPGPNVPPRAILDASGELLRAQSASPRVAIFAHLAQSPCCVHEVVDRLDETQPPISQHPRVLKPAGVVTGTRSGREVPYQLVDHHLTAIVLAAVAHVGERR
jgi:ArsR family transcriptional regulator